MPSSGKDGCDRFIPSATGPLHFGSLVAAVVSYLDARTRVRAGFGGCRRSICRTMCWAGLFAQVYCRFGRRRRQLMVGWFITVLVLPPGRTPHAWRLRLTADEVAFEDRLQGWGCPQLEQPIAKPATQSMMSARLAEVCRELFNFSGSLLQMISSLRLPPYLAACLLARV